MYVKTSQKTSDKGRRDRFRCCGCFVRTLRWLYGKERQKRAQIEYSIGRLKIEIEEERLGTRKVDFHCFTLRTNGTNFCVQEDVEQ
jgi:hypothetical protein